MNDLVSRIQHAQSLAADLASLLKEESNPSVPTDVLDIVVQLTEKISAMLTERRHKSKIPKDPVITHLLTTNAGAFTKEIQINRVYPILSRTGFESGYLVIRLILSLVILS